MGAMVRHCVGSSLARCSSFSSSSRVHSVFLIAGSSHSYQRALHCLADLRTSSDEMRAHWFRPYFITAALRISSCALPAQELAQQALQRARGLLRTRTAPAGASGARYDCGPSAGRPRAGRRVSVFLNTPPFTRMRMVAASSLSWGPPLPHPSLLLQSTT